MNSLYDESPFLEHHGIKGQKWGVRRFQNPDGTLTKEGIEHYTKKAMSKAHTRNMDKWGKTPETNTLYIAGYSGSGKSTTAIGLARKNDHIITLDGYSEPDEAASTSRNKTFNRYLDKHVPKWREMPNASDTTSLKRFSKEYWKTVEAFDKAIDEFSKEQYSKGNRVIVEGVQIADDWLKGNKKDYLGKPMVILQTNPVTSMQRAFTRDERGSLLKGLLSLDEPKDFVKWYVNSNKRLKELAEATINEGEAFIKK